MCLTLMYHTSPITPDITTLSLHDALPISPRIPTTTNDRTSPAVKLPRSVRPNTSPITKQPRIFTLKVASGKFAISSLANSSRSEEHTSELQSRENIVCRLLLEKKKQKTKQ